MRSTTQAGNGETITQTAPETGLFLTSALCRRRIAHNPAKTRFDTAGVRPNPRQRQAGRPVTRARPQAKTATATPPARPHSRRQRGLRHRRLLCHCDAGPACHILPEAARDTSDRAGRHAPRLIRLATRVPPSIPAIIHQIGSGASCDGPARAAGGFSKCRSRWQ